MGFIAINKIRFGKKLEKMNKQQYMAIVLAQKGFNNADALGQVLYKYNFLMHYTESIDEFINIFTKENEGFIFVDSQYYRFALLLKNAVEKVDIFKKYTIIFFGDNDACREDLANGINIFSCSSDKLLDLSKKLLSHYARRKRQENITNNTSMPDSGIKKFLENFGFSPRYKGFAYTVSAIKLGSRRKINNLRKDVFEKLSEYYETPLINIERNIRVLFTNRMDQNHLKNLLRSFIGFKPEKLTTKNFILIMTEIYKLRLKNPHRALAKSLIDEMKKLELEKIKDTQLLG